MDEFGGIAAIAGLIFGYGLISKRLETTPITGPIVFVVAGIALGPDALAVIDVGIDSGILRTIAEGTLVLVLFTDAIRIDLVRLRSAASLPGRLLGIGLPLTVAFGAAAGAFLLSDLHVWEAALVAAVLTPTDAALGQAVVSSARVPRRIRQTINVESGLNDGLMLPIVTVLIALAGAEMAVAGPASWTSFAAQQIGFGIIVGIGVGYAGGRILDRATAAGLVDGVFRQLATLAIGVGAFAVAQIAGGNGFVAAFVAGISFGAAAREHCSGAYDFAQDEGHLLAMLTFLFFGAAMAGPALDSLTWQIGVYVVASLTIVRMIPVALSLIGSGLRAPTVAFVVWFGPRGIASILFVLLVIEEAALPGAETILVAVTWTVLASIAAHGASAAWLSQRYGDWAQTRPTPVEDEDVPDMPTRR